MIVRGPGLHNRGSSPRENNMAFERRTSVSGKTSEGKPVFGWLAGHWNLSSASKWARRMGAIGTVNVDHQVIDKSGRGRGGSDGKWSIQIHEGGA